MDKNLKHYACTLWIQLKRHISLSKHRHTHTHTQSASIIYVYNGMHNTVVSIVYGDWIVDIWKTKIFLNRKKILSTISDCITTNGKQQSSTMLETNDNIMRSKLCNRSYFLSPISVNIQSIYRQNNVRLQFLLLYYCCFFFFLHLNLWMSVDSSPLDTFSCT